MKLNVSHEQLLDMLAAHIVDTSAGMLLDAQIAEITAIDQAGQAFPLDKIVVELASADKPMPKSREFQTPTGRIMRLASYEGVAL